MVESSPKVGTDRRKRIPWLLAAGLLFLGLAFYAGSGAAPAEDTQAIISAFHKLYYGSQSQTWGNTYWLGTPVLKATSDLWVFQEIIYHTKPDVIIEAGTYKGGSAYYMASICELLNHGRVITIDVILPKELPQHKRIKYLRGSSTSPKIIADIKKSIQPDDKIMVVLDSDHSKKHVLNELNIYSKFVTKGNYLIVEDTNVDHYAIWKGPNRGPGEAVREFLQNNQDFAPDKTREKFFLTFNPGGYLRKVR